LRILLDSNLRCALTTSSRPPSYGPVAVNTALLRDVPSTKGGQRCVTVWTDNAEIFNSMIISNTVDVVQNEGHLLSLPNGSLSAQLTYWGLHAFSVQALLEFFGRCFSMFD
jgi:hypothetical protein